MGTHFDATLQTHDFRDATFLGHFYLDDDCHWHLHLAEVFVCAVWTTRQERLGAAHFQQVGMDDYGSARSYCHANSILGWSQ